MKRLIPLLALALGSCAGNQDVEGDDAGECSDGADNDQNGYFDCQDAGCWNSPDCDGSGGGNDTGTSGGDDTGGREDCTADIGPFSHVNSANVQFVLELDYDETNEFCFYLQDLGAINKCSMTWEGSANNVVERCRPPERITLEGSFSRVASTCDPDTSDNEPGILEQGTWGNETNETAYISVVMSPDDPGFVETVIGHQFVNRWEPSEEPVSDKQYYETAIGGVQFENGDTRINYVGTSTDTQQNCTFEYTSTVTVDFNQ